MTSATDHAPPAEPPPTGADTDLRPDETRRWQLALAAPAVLGVPWAILATQPPGAAGGWRIPDPLQGVAGATLLLLVAVTTVTDLRGRRIPNWATYTAAAWGLVLALGASLVADTGGFRLPRAADPVPVERLLSSATIGQAAGGFGLAFAIMFVLYGIFQGGAGDVKLAAALGALVGPDRILNALVYGYIVAGVAVACWLVLVVGPGGLFREVARGLRPQATAPAGADDRVLHRKLAMAPFLNAGVLLAIFW